MKDKGEVKKILGRFWCDLNEVMQDLKNEGWSDEEWAEILDMTKRDVAQQIDQLFDIHLEEGQELAVVEKDGELPKVIISKDMSGKDGWYKKTVWEYAQETMLEAGFKKVVRGVK